MSMSARIDRSQKFSWRIVAFPGLALLLATVISGRSLARDERPQADMEQQVTQGALRISGEGGELVECPLKHTDVQAQVAGFVARVRVTQTFYNPTNQRIEATYVYPLPHQAAVDHMTMVLGERRIEGQIKRRAEARQIYEQALAQGQTAALLEQQRPNIFTQDVGNIEPGQEVRVEISYVDTLRYDLGVYEFQFPMVVGPRYHPGSAISPGQPVPAPLQNKVSPPTPDTSRVPDASKISPPVLKPGFRNGHDISLTVELDAGVPLRDLEVTNHEISVEQTSPHSASIVLSPEDSIPNKDFVLRYTVVGKQPEVALLAHTGQHAADAVRLGKGYFLLMIQPQQDDRLNKMPPREIVFLVDVSGSMRGDKTAKVIQAMSEMLKQCRAQDTVQVITFASRSNRLFPNPLPVTEANIRKALDYSAGLKGGGGTEMLKGVKMAIDEPLDEERLRIVVMLTDGFIGNEAEIIEHVGQKCGDQIRFWAIGIGSSPNMFLIDGVARHGGGMGKGLGLNDDTVALTHEIMTRIQRAQLAQVKVDWGEMAVSQTYPARIPELWAGRPIVVYGRYAGSASQHVIKIKGKVEGEPVAWQVTVDLPAEEPSHDALANVWARQKIEDLLQQTYYQGSPAVEEEVTQLALDYRLMSPYTSFVAVDSSQPATADPPTPPLRMPVPIPLPEGAVWEGFFGEEMAELEADGLSVLNRAPSRPTALSKAWGRGGASRALRDTNVAKSAATAQLGTLVSPLSPSTVRPVSRGERLALGLTPARGVAVRKSRVLYAARGVDRLTEGRTQHWAELSSRRQRYASSDGVLRQSVAGGGYGYSGYPLGLPDALKSLSELANRLQDEVVELESAGQLEAAQAALTTVQLLQHCGVMPSDAPAEGAPSPVELRQRQVDAWRKQLPALDGRIDLELRNVGLSEAISTLATAAGLNVHLVEGSLDDATQLLDRRQLRVDYLRVDSRTAWETLDALLFPHRLQWQIDDQGRIQVTSARRQPHRSAWVYYVGHLALPLPEERNEASDASTGGALLVQELQEFQQALHQALKLTESDALHLLVTGQLLVYGDAALHQQTASLIDTLSRAAPQDAPVAFQTLVRKVQKRLVARRPQIEQRRQDHQNQRLTVLQDQASWSLLADAAVAHLNPQALTELQIAWSAPETAKMLDDDRYALLLTRSLWAIKQSAAALPDAESLQDLARLAEGLSQEMLERTARRLQQQPDEAVLWTAVLTCLIRSEAISADEILRAAEALQTGTAATGADVLPVARALLQRPDVPALSAHASVSQEKALLPETVILTALACRRAGGEAWNAFRANAQDWLGRQPLPGELVILVNRLPQATF